MFKSYRVGTLFGFPIEVNASFLIILAVAALFWGPQGLLIIPLAFGSVLLHELGHALMARHLGVRVAGIELHFFGGAAKMVQQPRNANDEIAIAAAGPAVSFALGGVGVALASLTGGVLFQLIAWLNTIIGLFNLVPALPMDGGRIFRALLSRRMGFYEATSTAIKVARVFAVGLGLFGLFTLQIYLILLAFVLWAMGSAELRMAEVSGYTSHPHSGAYTGHPDVEVMPRDFTPGGGTHFHRPVASGGFVIRSRNGRFVIEPIE